MVTECARIFKGRNKWPVEGKRGFSKRTRIEGTKQYVDGATRLKKCSNRGYGSVTYLHFYETLTPTNQRTHQPTDHPTDGNEALMEVTLPIVGVSLRSHEFAGNSEFVLRQVCGKLTASWCRGSRSRRAAPQATSRDSNRAHAKITKNDVADRC